MKANRDYIEFIDHLIAMTQNNTVSWKRSSPPNNLMGTEQEVDFVYTTTYQGKNLRVYEENYKHFTDEFEFFWAERPIVEFTDINFTPLWRFPILSNTYNLLETIRYKDAGVDDFISSVLGR